MSKPLQAALDNYINWMQKKALPLWRTKGIDRYGASIEQFLANGDPDSLSNKRMRVQARQMFVFSAAQSYGWIDDGMTLVASIDRFVTQNAIVSNTKQIAHLLDSKNNIINSNFDLYDVAFFLLAYAWRYKVFNDLNALNSANKMLISIDYQLKESPGGWMEGDYDAPYRRQNPHMHLFESFLSLYQVSNDAKWLAKAGEIYCLFETIFFDHKNGVLIEYFDNHWQPVSGALGRTVEPGHMMEWVWLLRQYQKFTNCPVNEYCEKLYHNALKLGLDKKSGLLFDEVCISGAVIKKSKRCWPMTEWIKASLAQSSIADDEYDYSSDALAAVTQLSNRYLDAFQSGQYVDSVDKNDKVVVSSAPASTLYHLMTAAIEVVRFRKPER